MRHLQTSIQRALPLIEAELALESQLVDIFVTDMCPHGETELLDMLVPLLKSKFKKKK